MVHFTVRPQIIRLCEFLYKKLYWVSVTRGLQWGLQGDLCEERPGLPGAGHSRFQPVP